MEKGAVANLNYQSACSEGEPSFTFNTYVTQREVMRLSEEHTKTDILNSTYCLICEEHFDTKTIFISYSYQKL